MQEIWKDIPNYNGYQVSNLGNVRTYNKTTFTKKHGIRHWQNRILKFKEKIPKSYLKHQGKQGKGYAVDLWKNGKPKTILVARLVAFTFYNKDINDTSLTVDHLDGNRLNNNLSNLEIVSLKENIQRAFKNGIMSNCKKTKIINKNNGYDKTYRSMSEASKAIGKNKSYISLKIKKNIYENENYKWNIL